MWGDICGNGMIITWKDDTKEKLFTLKYLMGRRGDGKVFIKFNFITFSFWLYDVKIFWLGCYSSPIFNGF